MDARIQPWLSIIFRSRRSACIAGRLNSEAHWTRNPGFFQRFASAAVFVANCGACNADKTNHKIWDFFFCSTQAKGEAPSFAVENVWPEVTFQRNNKHLQLLTREGAPGISRWLQQRFVFSQTVGPLQDKPEAMCNKKWSTQYFWCSEMLTSASIFLANLTPNWSKSNWFRFRWKISICTGDPRLGGRGGSSSLGYRDSQAALYNRMAAEFRLISTWQKSRRLSRGIRFFPPIKYLLKLTLSRLVSLKSVWA